MYKNVKILLICTLSILASCGEVKKDVNTTIAKKLERVETNENIPIYIEEFDKQVTIAKGNEVLDSLSLTLGDGELKIYQINRKGACEIEHFDSNKVIRVKGEYSESLEVLVKYMVYEDPSVNRVWMETYKYYQPLPSGVWKHYSETGKLIKIETWSKGILIDSVVPE